MIQYYFTIVSMALDAQSTEYPTFKLADKVIMEMDNENTSLGPIQGLWHAGPSNTY